MKFSRYISLIFLAIFSSLCLVAQADFLEGRFNPELQRIDSAEGRERILAFRNFHYQGDYSLQFALIHLPRRGGREMFMGTLWGSWNEQGPITRVELRPYQGQQKPIRLLIQNGSKPKIWSLEDGQVKELEQKDWFNPIIANTVYTYFDLSLSFLFWDKFAYCGPQRVIGRPAQLFVMYPPPGYSNLSGVNLAMDNDYNVLLQATLLGPRSQPIKSIKLNTFQKVSDEYIIKQMDIIDEATHDKTRFEVTEAAMKLSIDTEDTKYFTPQSLNTENPQISRDKYLVVR